MIKLSKDKFIPDTEFVCDECGNVLECVPITVIFGYGHYLDDNKETHFCKDECLISYIKKERAKLNLDKKDERFIYGEKKNDEEIVELDDRLITPQGKKKLLIIMEKLKKIINLIRNS